MQKVGIRSQIAGVLEQKETPASPQERENDA